jgi:hypothetical protein
VAASSATAVSFAPLVWTLPSVTGKTADVVVPVIATRPELSTAIMPPFSFPLPPRKARYMRESAPEAAGSIFAMKKSVAPPGPVVAEADSGNVEDEVVVPAI